jgi:hypothetical protein
VVRTAEGLTATPSTRVSLEGIPCDGRVRLHDSPKDKFLRPNKLRLDDRPFCDDVEMNQFCLKPLHRPRIQPNQHSASSCAQALLRYLIFGLWHVWLGLSACLRARVFFWGVDLHMCLCSCAWDADIPQKLELFSPLTPLQWCCFMRGGVLWDIVRLRALECATRKWLATTPMTSRTLTASPVATIKTRPF